MRFDPEYAPKLSDFDHLVYYTTVPQGHFLRKALDAVPWEDFEELLAPYYSRNRGRPAESAVLMLKLEYLRYHHNDSDRGVIDRAETDMAYRYFLQLPVSYGLPDPSSLCVFRGRLGREGFREIFRQVVAAARAQGIVKDRLRIKDATHVLANIAVPTALALVAQTRDKLLQSAEPFAPLLVEGERVQLDTLREETKSRAATDRLATRVAHLKQILIWADQVAEPEDPAVDREWRSFLAQRDLAHKILEDQEHPNAGDRIRSTTDPDARRNKHGQWYDGYLTDIIMDADSEIITEINVLPANGDEAGDAVDLVRQEEAAHGNDVQALSIDGAGNDGRLLRELEDPDGLNVDTYVPPRKEPDTGRFTPEDFQEDTEREVAVCPAGKTSRSRKRHNNRSTTIYEFAMDDCRTCPLMARCLKPLSRRRRGRSVRKLDYQKEHRKMREKATTTAYAEVRREHPKVERKLGEVMNCHGGRHARYRGRWKVLIQELMASMATNIKRLVRLQCAPVAQVCCES